MISEEGLAYLKVDSRVFDPAVAEGYRATMAALLKLDRPVQALRRRASLADQQKAKSGR